MPVEEPPDDAFDNSVYLIYSIVLEYNALHVSRGKAKTPYEFGCKAGLVITARKNWIVAAHALHGNPFDGKTLKKSIHHAEKNTGVKVDKAFVDKGYRGSNHHPAHVRVLISGRKRLTPSLKRKRFTKLFCLAGLFG